MKQITDLEHKCVQLRYFEGLPCQEIADKLGLTVHQVKYRLRKPKVKNHIRKTVVPKLIRPILKQIDKRLAKPIESYMAQLIANSEAQTYQWQGPGKKVYQADERKNLQAIVKALRIFRVAGDKKNIERDLRKAVAKHIDWLEGKRKEIENALETGEIRFPVIERLRAKKSSFSDYSPLSSGGVERLGRAC